jgi:hypothetical protein
MANSSVVFCVRNGCLFCHQKKELGPIDPGTHQKNSCSILIWNMLYRPSSFAALAKILRSGPGIFDPSKSLMVSGKYIYLCSSAIALILLFEEK